MQVDDWFQQNRQAIAERRPMPEQPFQAYALAAQRHATVHLAPNLRIALEPRRGAMKGNQHILAFRLARLQEPGNRPAVVRGQFRDFQGGNHAVSRFDLRDSRPVNAKDIGGVLLTDAGLLARVTQPTCKFIAVDSHFSPSSCCVPLAILLNRTDIVNY